MEKVGVFVKYGAIILIVVFVARWGLRFFASVGSSFNGVQPSLNLTGPGYYPYPYNTGVVVMTPGIVGPQWQRYSQGRGRRR
jgi:hypothetical protein